LVSTRACRPSLVPTRRGVRGGGEGGFSVSEDSVCSASSHLDQSADEIVARVATARGRQSLVHDRLQVPAEDIGGGEAVGTGVGMVGDHLPVGGWMGGWCRYSSSPVCRGRGKGGNGRQGKARQGKARQGKARQGKARQGRESACFSRTSTSRFLSSPSFYY
jgi:hypothetical protein